ncbi:uncharacterized protein METZ01_LOCUS173344 [marine metagenome]|uniref:Uncharacterized protein n=1 Tax=marine metagenome TaxID=408172 RepID=A0A382C369_9ZZZZ
MLLWNVSKDKKTGLDNPLENNKDGMKPLEFCLNSKLNQQLDTKVEIGSRNWQ